MFPKKAEEEQLLAKYHAEDTQQRDSAGAAPQTQLPQPAST